MNFKKFLFLVAEYIILTGVFFGMFCATHVFLDEVIDVRSRTQRSIENFIAGAWCLWVVFAPIWYGTYKACTRIFSKKKNKETA